MVRVAASLKNRVCPAHVVVQRLANSSPSDRLAKALTMLGRAVTRGRLWPVAGLAVHAANGAAFGLVFHELRARTRIDPVLARSWLLVNGAQYDRFAPAAHSRADRDGTAGSTGAASRSTRNHAAIASSRPA